MKRATKFSVSSAWRLVLLDMGIDPTAVLTHANLSPDLFNRDNASLTPKEYFQFWYGVEQAAGEREIPLLLAENMTVEAFDAPIFAAICSKNLNAAVERLQQYKPLIGPMDMEVKIDHDKTVVSLTCYGYQQPLPGSLGLSEMVFFTQLARLATREKILPLKIIVPKMPDDKASYRDYFGCDVSEGHTTTIEFSSRDANKPFITHNAQMWSFFEEKLNRKLNDIGSDAGMVDRVRAILLESLPSGHSSADYVASQLAISKRTLQRKLTAEAETFQSVLQSVRLDLADHYLERSTMSLGEISFLLGFQESNSFIRAYSSWKGTSPASYRETKH